VLAELVLSGTTLTPIEAFAIDRFSEFVPEQASNLHTEH